MENCETCQHYYEGYKTSVCSHCEWYSHYEPKMTVKPGDFVPLLGDDDGDA